jgi:hypothetical protein
MLILFAMLTLTCTTPFHRDCAELYLAGVRVSFSCASTNGSNVHGVQTLPTQDLRCKYSVSNLVSTASRCKGSVHSSISLHTTG